METVRSTWLRESESVVPELKERFFGIFSFSTQLVLSTVSFELRVCFRLILVCISLRFVEFSQLLFLFSRVGVAL